MLVAVSFAVTLPILVNGIPIGYDLPHHYQCAMTFCDSIRNGDLYPSWSLNRNLGFGGMEARLYPPISHYTLALAYLLLGDWHLACWLVLLFFSFVGGYGVYLWAREYMPSGQAVFAGCIFIVLPYHLTQFYNTFFYAEFVGTSILPFSFVYVSRVCKRGDIKDVLGLAISFAILVLTHLPLTVMVSICLTAYGLVLLRRGEYFSQITKLAIGAVLGLAASSFFWIKVLLERDLLAKTLIYSDPWLDYRLHFLLTPIQTYQDGMPMDVYSSATYFYDWMFLYTVLMVVATAVPFLILKRKQFVRLKGVWAVFLLCAFLAIPFSRVLWDRVGLLQEVQFPWRWLALISATASVVAASHIGMIAGWFRTTKRPFALIISGFILAMIAFSVGQVIRQAPFVATIDVPGYMEKLEADKGFTFWWTIWMRKPIFEKKDKVIAEGRNIDIEEWAATQKAFRISNGDSQYARVRLFYHPNWKATVNDVPAETSPDENGALLVSLPADEVEVKVFFQEPIQVLIGRWVSLGAWILFLALWIGSKWNLRLPINYRLN